MKLYYSKGACSLAVRILIHEMKIPCVFEAVNLKAKKTESGEDFLKINPKGAVPTLQLNNNEVLTENAVIQQYLADINNAHLLLPQMGDFKRYRVLEWLNFVSSDLHKTFSPLFNSETPEDCANQFRNILKSKLDRVNQHLSDKAFLTGETFTLPDAYLFAVLRWLKIAKLEIENWPNVSRYFETLKTRPAIQKSLEEEGIS